MSGEDRVRMTAEVLLTMDEAHVERYKDWITDKYAATLEGGIKGRTKGLIEELAKRIKIAV